MRKSKGLEWLHYFLITGVITGVAYAGMVYQWDWTVFGLAVLVSLVVVDKVLHAWFRLG